MTTMAAVRLPGDSTVEHVTVDVPSPDRVRSCCGCAPPASAAATSARSTASTSDTAPRPTRASSPGTSPAATSSSLGPGVRTLEVGDRVAVYHITGCGSCDECRVGYPIGCTSPTRAAHGWQRDGGHADYMLAEAVSCLRLPEGVSHVDGALVSCGFGTAYEGLLRGGVSGRDRLLVTGLGPVGLAAAMLGRHLGASTVIGLEPNAERASLAAEPGPRRRRRHGPRRAPRCRR